MASQIPATLYEQGEKSMNRSQPGPLQAVRAETIGDPAFVVDPRGVITSWNDAATALFGRNAADSVGHRCPALVLGHLPTGELACTLECPLIQGAGVEPGPPVVALAVRTGRRPVRFRLALVQHIPLADAIGRPAGMLHIVLPSGGMERKPLDPFSVQARDGLLHIPGRYFG